MPANPRDIRAGGAYIEIGAIDDKLRAALDGAAKRLRTFAKTVAAIGASIQAISLVPLTSLFALAGLAAKSGDNFSNLAARTGLTVSELAALGQGAENAGSSLDTVVAAVKKLQVQVTELGRGSSSGVALFRKFGLAAADLVGKSPYEQLKKIADVLQRIPDPGQRAYAATELLGKSGAELIPVLAAGGKGLEDLYRHMEKLGIITGAKAAAEVAEFDDVLSDMVKQVGALKNVVGAAAAETFLPLVKAIQPVLAAAIEFIDKNRRLVGQIIVASGVVLILGTAVVTTGVGIYTASLAFNGFSAVIGLALSPLTALVGALGLAKRAFSAFTNVAGLAVRAVVGVGSGVSSLVGAFASVTGSILTLVSGSVIGGITALAGAFGLLASASIAAVSTVIGSLTALVGGAVSIVGGLVAVLTPIIVSTVAAIATVVGGAIVTAFAFIDAVIGASIIVAVGAIAPAIAGIVSAAVFAIVEAGGLLMVAAGFVGAAVIHGLFKGFSGLSDLLASIYDSIAAVFRDVGDFLVSTFSSAFAAVTRIVSSIGTFFVGIGQSIAAGFSNVVGFIGSAASSVASFFASIPGYARQAFAAMASFGQTAAAFLGDVFSDLKSTLGQTFQGALDALQAWDLALAGEIAFVGLQLAWQRSVAAMKLVWFSAKQAIVNFAIDKYIEVATAFNELLATMDTLWVKGLAGLRAAWVLFSSAFMGIWDAAINFVEDGLLVIISKVQGIKLEDLQKQAANDRAARARARAEETNRQLADISTGQQQRLNDIKDELRKRNEELKRLKGSEQIGLSDEQKKSISDTEAQIAALQKQLDALTGKAAKENDEANRERENPKFDPLDLGIDQAIKAVGTFNGAAVGAIFAGGSTPLQDIKKSTDKAAKYSEIMSNTLVAIAARRQALTFK